MADEVVRILDETVDWYRMLGVQQQSATQPSDLLFLYANRQAANRVVALAFELARANAELLSSQAELQQDADTGDSTSPQAAPWETVAPTSGGSKWTSSPSESWANQVIPSVASSPSIRAQSCSAW